MYKELDKSKIYDSSRLSFLFEFRSPIRRRDLASKLSKNLGIHVKWFKGVNEEFKPNDSVFKLSNKYSEQSKFYVFETGFMEYHDAIHVMLKAMNLIDKFGYTDDRCEVKVKASINEKNFHKLNKFKYVIGFDESKILEKWNTKISERHKLNQSNTFSIKAMDPYNTIISTASLERMDQNTFKFPDSEYFGIDFSNIGESYVTINYIGGVDYQKRKREAVECINSVISRMHETLENNWSYNIEEKRKIEKLVENYKNVIIDTKTYSRLRSKYPNLDIYFDLRKNEYLLETNYNHFRNKIFELIIYGGINEAQINWDNDRKKIQVKDATIKKTIELKDFEFYNCVVEADASDCLFDNCTIKNSKLENCDIVSSNYIKNSKVLECKYHGIDNEIANSYLDNNPNDMIDADLRNCLVNRGKFKITSNIDKDTIILNK